MASLGRIAIGMAAARIYPSQPLSGRAWLGAAAAWSALSMQCNSGGLQLLSQRTTRGARGVWPF
jgi:hypothetical protein